MFYKGQTIRSQYHGLGEVTMTGKHPRVRFLDGRELQVPGNLIRLVPRHVYDSEVRNRLMIERWLTCRIYGELPTETAILPRPCFDLANVMERAAKFPPLPSVISREWESAILYFD